MRELEVVIQPTSLSVEPMPEGSSAVASWNSDGCLRIDNESVDARGTAFRHVLCSDLASDADPQAYVGGWEVFSERESGWKKVAMDRITGTVKVATVRPGLGSIGGPDLYLEYEYNGLQSGSYTYRQGSIHLSSDELVRR